MPKKPIAISEALDQAYLAYTANPSLEEDSFYQALYKFVANHRVSSHDDDETQEAVIRIWQNLPSFKGTAKFSTWAFQVAQNSIQYEKRRGSYRKGIEVSLDELIESGQSAQLGEAKELGPEEARVVAEALQSLTDRQREVVTLMREGWTEKAIGEMLGITQGAVSEHWRTSLKKLEGK